MLLLTDPNTNHCHSLHFLNAPKKHPTSVYASSPPLLSSPLLLQRHWVDVHQEAHAGWYHHRLRVWSGLHVASRHSIHDTRLEEAAIGYFCPGIPAYLLYMVGTLIHCVFILVYDNSTEMPPLWSSLLPHPFFLALYLTIVHSLFSLSPVRVLPQSARWLLANDRREEAIALLRKAALVNGRVLPPAVQVCLCIWCYLLQSHYLSC